MKISRRSVLPVLLGAACRRSSDTVRIVVGGQSDLVYLPTTLAQQNGDFTAQGIKVQIDDTGAGSKSLQAILGGSADVATGFYDHAVQMAADGKDVKSFVTLTRYPGAVLLTSPEGSKRISRIEDLKGTNVGVTGPGSSSHFFVNYLLVTHGLSPDDIHVIAMGGGRSRVAALQNSKVDAGVTFEPSTSFVLRRAPGARVLADTRTEAGVREVFGVEHYPSAVLYATAGWLNDNKDTARRLALAMRRTLRWIQEHTAAEIASAMPSEFRADDPEAYTQAVETSKQLYSPDGVMHADAAAAVRKVLAVSIPKVRGAEIDLTRTYTNEFLD